MVDHPVIALLCSILIGPLGIQGWIVSKKNAAYGTTVPVQQGISLALYALIAALLAISVVRVMSTT